MPTITAKELIDRAHTVLLDKTGTRWERSELLDWLNDAQRQVVIHRPDAHAENKSFVVDVENTLQALPDGALRLIDVVRDGNGRSVTLVERRILDEQDPYWHSSTPSNEIEHYVYDERDPKHFYLYPKPVIGVLVQLVYSSSPEVITDESTVIGLDDVYSTPILDFMLYRAFAKDADFAANAQRMITHMQAFSDALGIKTQIDQFYSPSQNSGIDPH